MEINKFITARPFLYHLTSKENAEKIVRHHKILSTNRLIDLSGKVEYQEIKRQKRGQHQTIIINGEAYLIRDQRPISEVALPKCLTDNWTVADYLEHLNDRVFMWPTLERLQRHFERYAHERPIIFRFSSQSIIDANPHVKFCRLNSGATRANSYLGGKAPERGPRSFLAADEFQYGPAQVAEVTFERECVIVGVVQQALKPEQFT